MLFFNKNTKIWTQLIKPLMLTIWKITSQLPVYYIYWLFSKYVQCYLLVILPYVYSGGANLKKWRVEVLSCLLGVKCSSSFQKLDPSDLIDIKQPYWRVEGQVPHNPPGATTVILQELSYYTYLLQKLLLMLHS